MCRVSVVSVLVGLALLFLAQTRDLFLDFSGIGALSAKGNFIQDYLSPVARAAFFSMLVALFWALPVHSVARLAVTQTAWLKSPYGLVQDQHDVEAARRAFEPAAIALPRILGGLCFVIPFFSAVLSIFDLLTGGDPALVQRAKLELIVFAVTLFLVGVLFALYMFRRRAWFNIVVARLQWERGRQTGLLSRRVPDAPRIGRVDDETELAKTLDSAIATAIFIALVLILIFPSLIDLFFFTRLRLVPVLLGAWVPLLGFFARRSHAARAPIIVLFALVVIGLDFWIGDDHRVDVVPAAANDRQITLREAMRVWSDANQCSQDLGACPSPIIVATTGGASRAAFFTVTALGLLLDATCPAPNVPSNGAPPGSMQSCSQQPIFAKRLFALSGVSGGAVGSALFAKALFDGSLDKKSYAPPCPAVGEDSSRPKPVSALYFGAQHPGTWRECLQIMLAEDFLTPVMAGLGFRDAFAFLGGYFPRLWPDRGHRLEKALQGAYAKFAPPGNGVASDGMAAPFLSTAPGGGDERWRPLLLLNSTSVETGRRFVFSALAPTYDLGAGQPPPSAQWLTDAYDFHTIVDAEGASRDASLAVAAHNSARFPVISPAGTLYAASPAAPLEPIFGRLVDGGYFDNFGTMTARDLALALAHFGLRPFIILITNDPGDAPSGDSEGAVAEAAFGEAAAPLRPPPDYEEPWWHFTPVIETILSARSAHGEYGVALLRKLIDPAVDEANLNPAGAAKASCFQSAVGAAEPCYAHLAVYAPPAKKSRGVASRVGEISMSWWASKLVQEYLDEQILIHPRNGGAPPHAVRTAQCLNRRALHAICRAMAGADLDQGTCETEVDRQIQAAGALPATCGATFVRATSVRRH
ncbi:MAG TPA: hypothetical protein VGY52_04825 [Roseiarcus sp.]|nr:hypothetical protein [Roseiarcus sp.]